MKKIIIYTLVSCISFSLYGQMGKVKPSGGKGTAPANVRVDLDKIRSKETNSGRTFDIPFYPKSMGRILASGPDARIKAYSITGLPVWIEGSLMPEDKINRQDAASCAKEFISLNNKSLGIKDPEQEFKVVQTMSEDQTTHLRLQQEYKGIEVWNAEVLFHTKDGIPYLFNGRYIPTPEDVDTNPQITLEQAIEIARGIRPVPDYTTEQLKFISGTPISGRLVIYTQIDKHDKGRLAYLIESHPDLISKYQYFIDAHDGSLIDEIRASCAIHHDHSCQHTQAAALPASLPHPASGTETLQWSPPLDGPATANASDLNGVNRLINTYLKSGSYYLIDASRPMFSGGTLPDDPKGAIWTIDAQNTSPQNNNFGVSHVASSNNTWNSKTAVSAHYNGGIAYEYFRTRFNRNSINGSGGTIISVINVTESDGSSMDNAFWNGSAMFYGNGNTGFKPLAGSLDVAGHEMSHGVIQATANLTYQGESGAMNESFADVFGVLIDRDDYRLGEDVVKLNAFPSGALRDMSNPHNGGGSLNDNGWQPNHMNEKYTGSQDNGGVHINSGILNFAFYKVATRLGKDDAEKIYYAALTKYLTKSSQFIDCRNAVIQAAKDLYGANSPNIGQIENSFAEVGIGAGSGTTNPPDYGTNPGEDFILFADANLNQIRLAQVSSGNITNLNYNNGLKSKISVSDDGSLAVFVGRDNVMYYIDFDWGAGTYNVGVLDNQYNWRNVVISKDGLRLAALLDIEEPYIYVFDLASNTSNAFELYNPTTGNGGIFTDNVEYADAMEFDHTGQFLMYDALSTLGFIGTQYWDIGFLYVWNKSSNNYGSGEIQKLFSSLPDGVSVGNAVFSKNSPNVIAFDYFEDGFNTVYQLWGGNIETGDADIIFENSTLSYPSFSKDDKYVIFNAESNNGNDVIGIQALAANKISPSGSPSILIDNSSWGTWFATGTRVISGVSEYQPLSDAVTVYPNPGSDRVTLDWNSNNSATGTIIVTDIQGNRIMTQSVHLNAGDNKTELSLDGLPQGAYLIEVQKNNRSKSVKLIKN